MKKAWILIFSVLFLAGSASAAVPTFDVGLNPKIDSLLLKEAGKSRSSGGVLGDLLGGVLGGGKNPIGGIIQKGLGQILGGSGEAGGGGGGGCFEVPDTVTDQATGVEEPTGGTTTVCVPAGGTSAGGGSISLDGLAWKIAKMYLHELSRQVVNWIRTGGQNGPLFVRNWEDFLLAAADQAGGQFLEELKLTQLCQPFGNRLRVILGSSGRRPYYERARCTISDVLKNVQNFYGDFSQGGWARWFEITQIPQNNFYGAYYMSLEEKLIAESSAVEAARNEGLASQGFLGTRKCEPQHFFDPDTEEDHIVGERCFLQTPGKAIEAQLAAVFGAEINQLNLADEMDEVLNAALDQMTRSVLFANGGLFESNISSSVITANNELQDLKLQVARQLSLPEAIARSQSIISQKQDSISKLNSEIQTLNSLKSCQLSKGLSTTDTNTKITAATNTISKLNGDINTQNTLTGKLLKDASDIDGAKTIQDLRDLISKVQLDVALIGSPDDAKKENDQISQEKQKAVDDLAECKKPSS